MSVNFKVQLNLCEKCLGGHFLASNGGPKKTPQFFHCFHCWKYEAKQEFLEGRGIQTMKKLCVGEGKGGYYLEQNIDICISLSS